ncbi:sulfatase-like hydrolase/transferase [Flammeovirga yaeyamensis]|uniref:Sulfatase-like hydrolase/transferase n=1 Tax=Flammeovirga yaeyamensis TaxID=367791 RepID=A0AAX1NC16_9BACT|nr:arylsulfatase [Flammeovirga yaeyamensis]MBB3697067.1 arylsulfatase A [Flammeovirga yaeyamensis]NMF33729.1 arylsulfatase [Flammeovirga yaeyamensis]QWG05005.1 sulfatase-like hydrolase/transferase [Flammeovirga yaeyamensis]
MEKFNKIYSLKGNALICVVCSLLFASCTAKVVQEQTQRPPNVIVILTDDQGWGDFSHTGNEYLKTPHFDKMTEEGAVLDKFYVSPVCAPTRASVLTGRYHLRTGVSFVTRGRENMRSEEVTIAEVFKEAGYATGCFGKWHNGAHYPENPQGQGFDTFLGFTSGHWSNYFDTELEYNGEMKPTKGFITDVLMDETIQFIDAHKDEPFLAFVPLNAPHTPYQVPDKYFDKYKDIDFGYDKKQNKKIATIYGMCENIDDNLGKLMQHLKDQELEKNTIVVFLSDNGPQGARYNGPWRGGKTSVHEGGTLVPCAIQWKGHIPNSSKSSLTAHIDLMPTLMGLAGIEKPENIQFDGMDLSNYLMGTSDDLGERNLYTHMTNFEITADRGAVRQGDYRFTTEYGDVGLYNLKEDPSEKNNLKDQLPEKTQELKTAFENWYKDVTSAGFSDLKIPMGYTESPRVVLAAHESNGKGDLAFKANVNGWAHDWYQVKGEAEVQWPVQVIQPSTFNVKLKYAGIDIIGSEMEFIIGDKVLSATIHQDFIPKALPTPDRVMREQEAKEQTWGILDLGSITLPSIDQTTASLIIKKKGKGILEIKEIETRKVTAQ